jgi:hypothetical protein
MHSPQSIELLEPRIAPAAVFTWDGGGADDHWTTPQNWVRDRAPIAGGALVFPAIASNAQSTNDFPSGTLFDSLAFPPAADGSNNSWTLSGDRVALANGIHSGAPNIFIEFAIALSDDQTFATEERGRYLNLSFNLLDLNGHTLLLSGAGHRFQALEVVDGSGSNESTIECLDDTTVRLPDSEAVPAKLILRGGEVTFGNNPATLVTLEDGNLFDFASSGAVLAHGGFIGGSSAATINGNLTMEAASVLDAHASVSIPTSTLSLSVVGSVSLDAPRLSFQPDENPRNGTTIILIDNDANDPVIGQFADLPEGALLDISNTRITAQFRITYKGGDGNDVALVAETPEAVISEDGKVATFTDVDGDRVTISTDDGELDPRSILLSQPNALGGHQLQLLDLQLARANSSGSKIVISSEQGPQGDGRVNVAAIHAYLTGISELTVDGDLGELYASRLDRLIVGSLGREIHTNSPAAKSFVDIESVSRMHVESDVFSHVRISYADEIIVEGSMIGGKARDAGYLEVGSARSIDIGGDVRGGKGLRSGSIIAADQGGPHGASTLGTVVIGGSLIGGKGANSGAVIARNGAIAEITIEGSILAAAHAGSDFAGSIIAGASIGELNVHGSILGTKTHPVWIAAAGVKNPRAALGVAIDSVTIDGDVRHTHILAGHASGDRNDRLFNADASIRRVVVKGDWRASNITAGVTVGPDGLIATSDDTLIEPPRRGIYRNDPDVASHIGIIKIFGDVVGTHSEGDSFGIVAQQIDRLRIGDRVYRFGEPSESTNLPLFLGSTGPGPNDAPSDFSIRIVN